VILKLSSLAAFDTMYPCTSSLNSMDLIAQPSCTPAGCLLCPNKVQLYSNVDHVASMQCMSS
jgi:hypothetical protein